MWLMAPQGIYSKVTPSKTSGAAGAHRNEESEDEWVEPASSLSISVE